MSINDARTIYMRKPVNQALNKIWEYPLTVVEAPMGYGKTTAVKEYLKRSRAEVLWQTLLDESATVFWKRLSRLFRKFDPAAADSLAGVGVPSNSVFLEEAIRIVEGIKFPARTVIVFDDYHLVSSQDVDQFVEFLVKSEIPNLHIVIVSRSVFGENTSELVLKGYCWVINKSYFVLSREEIVEYCRLCGVKLNPEEVEFLVSYTEGWISAVYLCLLGFLQDGRIEHQVSLYELIEKVVYRRVSAEAREFLLNICIFDNFTLEQAEYMWRKDNVETLLRQLAANNAFIRYEQATRTYYIHNIFSSYLRRIFDRQGLDRKQAVWSMAGEWHVSVGDCIHALDYFFKADDFEDLLTAIEIDRGNGIWSEHKEKLIRYFHDCPMDIKRGHLQACLIYAINLFSFNEMELFAQQCEEIGRYIEVMPGEKEQEKDQLAGELELLCSFAKYNHIAGMSEHIQRADSLMKGPSEFMDRNSSWTFGSPSVMYMFYRESGHLEQEVLDLNVAITQYCRLTAGHGSGADSMMQAERYYHIGDFENAEIAAHKALYIARSQEQTAIELCALFLQLRLAVVKGDAVYMMSSLQQTREGIKQQKLYLYLHTWDMCEGFIYSYLNQEKKVPAWIVNGDLQDRSIYFPSYAFFNIVWGKVLLIDGQYLKLIGLAERFIDIASIFPNLLGQVYTYIFEAAAKFKLRRHEDARITLKKALDIAAPDQVMMPFVENGEYIVDMLTELENSGHYPELIGKIREILPSIEKNRETMSAKFSSGDSKLPLTEREWTIAELVATGLPNRAIGQTLHIAEVTVKKALQNIYVKLGVSSRTALAKIMIEHKTG
ncbi:LuxR C-terminal-related transcriptional regulator [Sporomusa malonica]|uniref:LuxR family transcriptional regulator, maltose regulon positive regulatory protein n=1 Tax=Sporomusa malonica TaxID=112901 RepID=A0A1W2E3S4_9FIRM|nr:LuxR C-terminal-related transcriptional regulator [Sporomusa malonica]SMD04423.1 LuxR family transcriptional regulator, maltose regulon positive regulatory protein [Sporomusa malonica]